MKQKNAAGLCVAFDGRRALHNPTGLGNYSRYTIEALSRFFKNDRFLVLGAGRVDPVFTQMLERCPNVEFSGPQGAVWKHWSSMWRSSAIGRQAAAMGADIYHGLSHEVPFIAGSAPLATVVTMHDLIWHKFPQDFHAIDHHIYSYKYGRSARLADRVIAISECTRRDVIEILGVPEEKVDVIYQGVDPAFRPASTEAVADVRGRYGLPERYVACVGTVQWRKNHLLAVQALRQLPQDVKLVVVGRRTDYARTVDRYIDRHHLADRVIRLEGLPFADLPPLYTGAAVSVYPSRYEGFGLPVVESLACGTPVVAATGSCLEEAGGEGALYVGPDDADACGDALNRIIDSTFLHDKLVDRGQLHIRKFNMDDYARRTMQTYTKAILSHNL